MPQNDYEEMLKSLRNLPPSSSTRNSICNCLCYEISKSPNHKAKPKGRPSPSPKRGGYLNVEN